MSFERDLRVGVFGATGSLGRELLRVLEDEKFPVKKLVPLATEHSLGEDLNFRGEEISVLSQAPPLEELDLLFLCAPAEASREMMQRALEAKLPCFDLSGSLGETEALPLLLSSVDAPEGALDSPVVASPSGQALTWATLLYPLRQKLGLTRAVGTVLESAGQGGRQGLESLSTESIALFSQQELPEEPGFGKVIAFDCHPVVGEVGENEMSSIERSMTAELGRLLGEEVGIGVTVVRVPAFAGQGGSLAIELAPDTSLEQLRSVIDEAPGLQLWEEGPQGPTLRDALGESEVLVGRVRVDPSAPGSFLLWVAADPIRLAALNAVELAMERFMRE